MRQQRGLRAQLHARSDDNISADVRSFADHRRRIDHRRRMNSRRVDRRLIEEAQRAREGQVGVLQPERRRFNLRELRLDQHGRSPGLARQPRVLGIGHEGHLRRPGLLNPFDSSDFQLRVSAQFRAQLRCQLA